MIENSINVAVLKLFSSHPRNLIWEKLQLQKDVSQSIKKKN